MAARASEGKRRAVGSLVFFERPAVCKSLGTLVAFKRPLDFSVSSLVPIQAINILVRLCALVARKRTVRAMRPLVVVPRGRISKRLIAFRAFERPLPSVQPHVNLQPRGIVASPSALFAGHRPLAGVNSLVFLQRILSAECFRTELACMRLLGAVLRPLMHTQMRDFRISLVACFACERSLAGVQAHVLIKASHLCKTPVAMLADVRSHPGVYEVMRRHRFETRKAQTAGDADKRAVVAVRQNMTS